MGNIITTIKRFLGNKNTVTILGVIAGVIVLWAFYSYRVKEATEPIKIPYAKEAISATEEITEDMIGMVEINSKFLKTANVIQNKAGLIGKYITTGTSIPAGGLFYVSQVVEKNALPNTIFDDIPDGYTIYSLSVDNHTTYGNSIYPGDNIDLYIKAVDDNGKIVYGEFIQGITVLGVRDSNGRNVFDSAEARVPAELLFTVPNDEYVLLKKAGYLSSITIVPVPRNKAYSSQGEKLEGDVAEYFKNYINAKTATIG